MTKVIRVAVANAEVVPGLDCMLAHTEALAAKAASDGAQLVVFPETWLPGYPAWLDVCRDVNLWDAPPVKRVFGRYLADSIAIGDAAWNRLSGLARSLSITLVIGVSERNELGPGRRTLFNSLLTFGTDGTMLNHHRKLVPTYTERMVWGTGDASGLRVVNAAVGRVGGLICWENWMPLARHALHEDAEDIHVAVWPTVKEMHLVACRQYAFEGRCFVLAAGSLMRTSSLPTELEPVAALSKADDLVLRGGSAIIGPDGQYLAGPSYDREEILFADLELGRIAEESMALDVTGHYARPDCFRLQRNPAAVSRTATHAAVGEIKRVSIAEKLSLFSEHWRPKVIAELNGQEVKLSKFQGPFVWHKHDDADEMFLVVRGSFDLELRDRTIALSEGELVVVPRGVEHRPVAADEVAILLFEPAGLTNTGDVTVSGYTARSVARI